MTKPRPDRLVARDLFTDPFGEDTARKEKYAPREEVEDDLDQLGAEGYAGKELDVKAKKAKASDYNSQTRDYWVTRRYVYHRVDRYDPRNMIAKDLFGFADAIAFKDADTVFIQICSAKTGGESMRGHLRKACSQELVPFTGTSSKARKADKMPDLERIEILRRWIRGGRRFLIMGWSAMGVNAVPEILDVTEADLDLVASRRRKK